MTNGFLSTSLDLVCGVVALGCGLFGKKFTYPKSDVPVPRWWGRTIFVIVGLVFLTAFVADVRGIPAH